MGMMMCKQVLLILWLATSCSASWISKIPKLELQDGKIEHLEVLWTKENATKLWGSANDNVAEFAKENNLGDLLRLRTFMLTRPIKRVRDDWERILTELNEARLLFEVLKITQVIL